MSREIKFRGKRIDNGEWVYGYYHFDDSGDGFDCHYITVKTDLDVHEVDPKTVGQYIGLRDLNGKEIFEGSIVEFRTGGNVYQSPVSYDESCACYVVEAQFFMLFDHIKYTAKVIGNIYDNHELLEVNGNA
ncbi:YopX protein [compost metagenome]